MIFNILLVDDDKEILKALSQTIKQDNTQIFMSENISEALLVLEEEEIDIILSDLVLPDGNGIDLLKKIKQERPETLFILMTGHSTVDNAVDALKSGAFDYITKPFNITEVRHLVDKAVGQLAVVKENEQLKEELTRLKGFDNIIGRSKAMQDIFRIIERVKDIDATVLITGESGSGKEVIARALHDKSKRKSGSFVALNCGAIPENLIEDELFGHVKGAFTDAVAPRIGAFEKAESGVLFLDEIGTLRLDLQVKLLRVLQEREFTPIGSPHLRKIDVRVVAATNSDLKEMVKRGEFREDLYYRLNIIHIAIPPLRERLEDILPLLKFMAQKVSSRLGMPEKNFSKSALEALLHYDYKGNVRELENIVERAMALSESDTAIDLSDLPAEVRDMEKTDSFVLTKDKSAALSYIENVGLDAYIKRVEKGFILSALTKHNWRKSKAARLLKLQRTTLFEKMKRFGIPLKQTGSGIEENGIEEEDDSED
jgi:two-component system, NtrC family, response regulator AtoC